MSLSDNYENYVLDNFFRNDTSNPVYRLNILRLATGVIEDSVDEYTEVQNPPSASGYASLTVNASDWTVSASGVGYKATNATSLTFNTATGGWGTLTHFALAESTNNKVGIYGTITPNQEIVAGDTPTFPPGALEITII